MAGFIDTIKKTFGYSEPELGQFAPTEVEPKRMTAKEFDDIVGSSGTPIVYGYISEEQNYKLRGQQGSKVFDEMRKTDAQVNASLLTMELPIRSTKWRIEPAQNEDGNVEEIDKEIAQFVEKNLFEYLDSTWDDLLREVLTMLPFGFSVFEKVFAIEETELGKKIILKKLAYRKQSTIARWQQKDGTPGVEQYLDSQATSGVNKGQTVLSIPAEKLVIFTYRREGDNYEGTSVLRSAYKHWFIKDKLYKFDAIRHERQGVGIPIIYIPDNATKDDKDYAGKIVKNIRATEQTGIVMPGSKDKGWAFEYADLKTSQNTGFQQSIDHHNREIVKNILAQFLELGNTESGSRSLGQSQVGYFLMSLESVAKYICGIFDKFIIKQIVDLNYDTKKYPTLTFESLEATDKKVVVDMISTLVSGGIIAPDKPLGDYVREMLDLPAQEEIEEPTLPEDTAEIDISDSADELPTEEEDVIDDTELDQYDQALSDMESGKMNEQGYGEVVTQIANIFTDGLEAYSCAFRAPMSEETKKKISEALKQKGSSDDVQQVKDLASKQLDKVNQQIESTRNELEKSVGELRFGIDSLKSKASKIPRGKKGKQARDAIKAQVAKIREQMKAIRASKKKMLELRKSQRDQIKEVYRQSKKEITVRERSQKKLQAEKARLLKKAQRAKEKTQTFAERSVHTCDHQHSENLFFDNQYFNELSSMVNNDFIKEIQKDDE